MAGQRDGRELGLMAVGDGVAARCVRQRVHGSETAGGTVMPGCFPL